MVQVMSLFIFTIFFIKYVLHWTLNMAKIVKVGQNADSTFLHLILCIT